MRTYYLALLALLFLLAPAYAARPGPHSFRSKAPVQGKFAPDQPARAALPRDVLAGTEALADVRLFDDRGLATPFVVRQERRQRQEKTRFTFEILSYDETDGRAEIVARRPKTASFYRRVRIETSARDFKKAVKLLASDDRQEWRELSADLIFDFSARLKLRQTTLEVAQTEAPYLKIILTNQEQPTVDGAPEVSLAYEGARVQINPARAKAFRIDAIVGLGEGEGGETAVLESAVVEPAAVSTDEDGDTIIELGQLNLPLAEVKFELDNPFYHRRVQLLGADEDLDDKYRVLAEGTIYYFPGMREHANTIACHDRQARFARLRIVNGDNPPLRLRRLQCFWAKHYLYFVPEGDRQYTLHFGNPDVGAARYDLDYLLPSPSAELKSFQALTLGPIKPNAAYDPGPTGPGMSERMQNFLLAALVVVLVGIVGLWLFGLARKLPAAAPDPEE